MMSEYICLHTYKCVELFSTLGHCTNGKHSVPWYYRIEDRPLLRELNEDADGGVYGTTYYQTLRPYA